MAYDPEIHRRRSIRLRGYDYTKAGAYFVTICTKDRVCLLGEICGGQMSLNQYGTIAQNCWEDLPEHYTNMELDAFVIMPNHVHGILLLTKSDNPQIVGTGFKPAPAQTNRYPIPKSPNKKQHGLSEFVRAFKTFSSRRINEIRHSGGIPVWQRNFY